MPQLYVSPAWKNETDGKAAFVVEGGTISTILKTFGERFPANKFRVLDETGSIYRYLNVFVDGTQVEYDEFDQFYVNSESVMDVLSPLAGG